MGIIKAALANVALWLAGFAHLQSWPYHLPQQPDDTAPTVEYLCHQTKVVGIQIDKIGAADELSTFYDTQDFIVRRVRPSDRRPTAAPMVQPGESWIAFDEIAPHGLVSGTEGFDHHVRLDGGGTNVSIDLQTGLFIRASMGLIESEDGHVDFYSMSDPHFSVGRCVPQLPTSTYPHASHF